MSKLVIMFFTLMLVGLAACGDAEAEKTFSTADGVIEAVTSESDMSGIEMEDSEMDEANKALIAEALGIESDSRSMRTIISGLKTIGAGTIKSAEAGNDNGQDILIVVAEDDTQYYIHLTGSGNLDCVKNVTTGEWVITSVR